jgi:hypothetical protein
VLKTPTLLSTVSDELTSQNPPPPAPTEPTGNDWARTARWIAIVLILTGAGVYVFKTCIEVPGDVAVKSGKAVREMGKALADVASAFRRGTVTTSFVSYATSVTNQQYLQFATLKQMEFFTHTDAPTTGFGYIPLPEVVVEARAPVEYTYYLDLNAEWKFVLQDQVIHVQAPSIRFNKPAIDVSRLNYEVKKGYFKTDEATERLKRSITSLVTLKARDNIHLVKETGRKQTAEFVETWLAKSFTDGKVYAVKVYFPDEKGQFSLIQTNSLSE